MSDFLVRNDAQPRRFAPASLNATLAERAESRLEAQEHAARPTASDLARRDAPLLARVFAEVPDVAA